MTKEMIKAIRLVNGLNPDLRVKLGYRSDSLYYWIEENRIGILGLDAAVKPDVTSPEWMRYEKMIETAVQDVLYGRFDK